MTMTSKLMSVTVISLLMLGHATFSQDQASEIQAEVYALEIAMH
jgi:hypothetical protein